MMRKLITGAVAAALVVALPSLAAAAPGANDSWHSAKHNPFVVPVSGPSNHGTFNGTMAIVGFVTNSTGGTDAIGLLNGTDGTSTITNQVITVPVLAADPTCNILTLNLGALHLDLLGLVVDLAPVNLVISAVSGPGNLVGNLLCAVANLLNGGLLGNTLTTLLNNLLTTLGGLGL